MTTATSNRTPHALEAGPAPALTWLAVQALNVGLDLAVLLSLPVLGSAYVEDANSLFARALILAGVVLAVHLLRRHLSKALQMRVPGGMRHYTPEDEGVEPPWAPDAIAATVRCGIFVAVAFSAAGMASEDGGFAAVLLLAFGAGFVTLGVSRATKDVLHFPRDWVRPVLYAALREVLPGASMLAAGSFIAPNEMPTTTIVAISVMSVVIYEVMLLAFAGSRSALREGASEASAAAADTFMTHVSPAPTLTDRARAHRWATVGFYGLLVALAAVLVAAF